MHVKYIDCVVFSMIRCNNFTYIINISGPIISLTWLENFVRHTKKYKNNNGCHYKNVELIVIEKFHQKVTSYNNSINITHPNFLVWL